MAFNISQGFDLNSPQFNFKRDYFASVADMKAASENNFPDNFITNVAGVLYQIKKSNTVDATTGKWRKVGLGNLGIDLSGYAKKTETVPSTTTVNGTAIGSTAKNISTSSFYYVTNVLESAPTISATSTATPTGIYAYQDGSSIYMIASSDSGTTFHSNWAATASIPAPNKICESSITNKGWLCNFNGIFYSETGKCFYAVQEGLLVSVEITADKVHWNNVTNKPTSLVGYGMDTKIIGNGNVLSQINISSNNMSMIQLQDFTAVPASLKVNERAIGTNTDRQILTGYLGEFDEYLSTPPTTIGTTSVTTPDKITIYKSTDLEGPTNNQVPIYYIIGKLSDGTYTNDFGKASLMGEELVTSKGWRVPKNALYMQQNTIDGNVLYGFYNGLLSVIPFTAPNSKKLNDWTRLQIQPTGQVGFNSTTGLEHYWAKLYSLTVTSDQNVANEITFLLSEFGQTISFHSIVCLNVVQRGENNSGAYNIGVTLHNLISSDSSKIRVYYNNTTGKVELWINCSTANGRIAGTILKKIKANSEVNSLGTLYNTPSLSTVQTLPTVGDGAYTLVNPTSVGVVNKAGTLVTARTLKIGNTGKTFNGSANVTWSLDEIGALSSTGGTVAGDLNITGDVHIEGKVDYNNGICGLMTFRDDVTFQGDVIDFPTITEEEINALFT